MPLTKKCGKCKVVKPLDQFYNSSSKSSLDGKGWRCKPCDSEARKATRARSPVQCLGYRKRALMWKYGMTLEDYDRKLEAQGGMCAICKTTNPVGEGNSTNFETFSFAVDHCHDTGKVRGLLCNPCNRGLGFFKDSPTVLRAAVDYLGAHA